VRLGKPEEEIPELIKRAGFQVDSVWGQKEVTSEETDAEKALEKALSKLKNSPKMNLLWGGLTMHHIDDLPFPLQGNGHLKVFTQFRQMMEQKNIPIRKPFPAPREKLQSPPGLTESSKEEHSLLAGEMPDLNKLMEIGGFSKWLDDHMSKDPHYKGENIVKENPRSNSKNHRDPAQVMRGGEKAGLERLHFYLWEGRHIDTYKSTRNGLLGSTYATKFSPWLAHGCLGARHIYHEIKKYEEKNGANDSTYWVFFELLWRDYFKWIGMKHKNDIFKLYGLRGKDGKGMSDRVWKQDKGDFEKWAKSQTGYPFVDANMLELTATGHMSNRGRQNVASFLTKDLKIDWRMGAEFFESFLIDHDVTSNYCNWMYVAGVGNDLREDRYFNVLKQGHMYDAQGEYICYWLPQLKKLPDANTMHQPFTFNGNSNFSLDKDYYHPIVKVSSSFKKEAGGGPKKRDFKIRQGGKGGKMVTDRAPKSHEKH